MIPLSQPLALPCHHAEAHSEDSDSHALLDSASSGIRLSERSCHCSVTAGQQKAQTNRKTRRVPRDFKLRLLPACCKTLHGEGLEPAQSTPLFRRDSRSREDEVTRLIRNSHGRAAFVFALFVLKYFRFYYPACCFFTADVALALQIWMCAPGCAFGDLC